MASKKKKVDPTQIVGPGKFRVRTTERVYYNDTLHEPDTEIIVTLREDHNLAEHFPWADPIAPVRADEELEGEE